MLLETPAWAGRLMEMSSPLPHSARGPGGHSYPDKGVPGTHTLCSLPTVLADVSRSLGEVVGPLVTQPLSVGR